MGPNDIELPNGAKRRERNINVGDTQLNLTINGRQMVRKRENSADHTVTRIQYHLIIIDSIISMDPTFPDSRLGNRSVL